ncbi:pentatricopeptide repeat-containing protein At2g33680-like [Selaginella moellendorffii]|uniref:pentatricopeptide repeat-containing protein At2g33680-like n=1 Tax=Selaginella moellendorffii TaxID=88036 RepID=UPI000D1C570C|nr:pentatricopeptide repeat-containing protein At2g33680-like [Selaginella moellendorffii]|eukprot:XP_024538328.1 pentatricopeptide repeat-containing protein At2g33680-like [Selaginella moellendorffii]
MQMLAKMDQWSFVELELRNNHCGIQLKVNVLLTALKASSNSKELELGKALHLNGIGSGHYSNPYVTNSLVNMYAKCGSLVDAKQVFDSMQARDAATWNSLIKGYVMNGKSEMAWELFSKMDCAPDDLTFVAAATACASLAASERGRNFGTGTVKVNSLERGMALHSQAEKSGYGSRIFLTSTLVDMYAKCGSMVDSRATFDRMVSHDVVSWNSLILGYVENGEVELALGVFESMDLERDSQAYVAALVACASLADKETAVVVDGKPVKQKCLERGRDLHSRAASSGYDRDSYVAGTLIDMYAKCGSMDDSQRVFDKSHRQDAVLWNTLVLGYAENGQPEKAVEAFDAMEASGCKPNIRSFISALVACGSLASQEQQGSSNINLTMPLNLRCLDKVMSLHSRVTREEGECQIFFGNTLVDAYAKCGSMLDSRRVFDRMQRHDVVSWTALILGYSDNGLNGLAVDLFFRMTTTSTTGAITPLASSDEHVDTSWPRPNARTFVAVLIACTRLGALEVGRRIHSQARDAGFHTDAFLANTLVDFYAKCGCMDEAEAVFSALESKSLVAWSALISGYSCHGSTDEAFAALEKMRASGIPPDGVTFLSVLTACSHGGLVEKGLSYFESMAPRYGVTPGVEHYHCVVDMLGRANRVVEAVKLAKEMPFEATVVTWTTVLGACHKWGNAVLGKLAFDRVVALDARAESAYVLMGNIYGGLGLRREQEEIGAMRDKAMFS